MKKTQLVFIIVLGALLIIGGIVVWHFLTAETIDSSGQSVLNRPENGPTSGNDRPATSISMAQPADRPQMDLPGMPSDYVLTEEQVAQKEALASSGMVADVEQLQPGVHYKEKEFIYIAKNREEAELIAAAYASVLVSYTEDVAVAKLESDDYLLRDLFAASADTSNNLPPISLNLIYSLD